MGADAAETKIERIRAYKALLQQVIDRRPAGTRGRLAAALGKNRSFVSQISSSNYMTPVPAQHIDTIFAVCDFSESEKYAFLEAYSSAHPRAAVEIPSPRNMRSVVVELVDRHDPDCNDAADRSLAAFVRLLNTVAGEGGEFPVRDSPAESEGGAGSHPDQ